MSIASRVIPNPESKLLKMAVIGGAGSAVPCGCEPPPGMGVLLLYVPLNQLARMALPAIQADVGLPWAVEGGGSAWFSDIAMAPGE
jgi:hypothetical protein